MAVTGVLRTAATVKSICMCILQTNPISAKCAISRTRTRARSENTWRCTSPPRRGPSLLQLPARATSLQRPQQSCPRPQKTRPRVPYRRQCRQSTTRPATARSRQTLTNGTFKNIFKRLSTRTLTFKRKPKAANRPGESTMASGPFYLTGWQKRACSGHERRRWPGQMPAMWGFVEPLIRGQTACLRRQQPLCTYRIISINCTAWFCT